MAKRYVALATVALLAAGYASTALAGDAYPSKQLAPLGQQKYFNDPPMSHLNALEFARGTGDTTYYGGVDGGGYLANEVTGGDGGVAVWDFEDGGSTQGWTTQDFTDLTVRVRAATATTFDGSTASGLITQDENGGSTSTGSLWFGSTTSEAEEGCWPGGMGYSNSWGMRADKVLPYGGGNVSLTFDYFADSEELFDFSYAYVIANGFKSDPLNTSMLPHPVSTKGYSGSDFFLMHGIGTPTEPESESITIDASNFPDDSEGNPPTEFTLSFNFDSDSLYSDGLDYTGGLGTFHDCIYGPFGVDNIRIDGGLVGTFEGGATDDWVFGIDPAIGAFMAARDLATLDAIGDPCDCPLLPTPDNPNQYVLVAANFGAEGFPHPQKQREQMTSNPAYVGGSDNNAIGILYSVWADNPRAAGVSYRVGLDYYPWTCEATGVVSWTAEISAPGGNALTAPASCDRFRSTLSSFYQAGSDSVRAVIRIAGDCDDWGVVQCIGPAETNQTPYFDDIQIWTAFAPNAPVLSWDLLYVDRYPTTNSLLPNTTVDVNCYFDYLRADNDPTNSTLGDSAVVFAGSGDNTRLFLNFRVYPGPETNTGHEFFTRYGGNFIAPGGVWAEARMDSAESQAGPSTGYYATYLHESAGGFEGNSRYKLIPDGVLTPGTTVEYFFTGDFGDGLPKDVEPDTTGAFYFEWEALPGYFDTGTDILGPCVLYVDAFNRGAQVPIEEYGLDPYLGMITDTNGLVHTGWDRYDYIQASNNTAGPFAREPTGNNGITKYQSLFYEAILYNTGSNAEEGLRDGTADLLMDWLTIDDLGRDTVRKGLWLSGNGLGFILDREGRLDANLLLAGFCKASQVCDAYRDPECGGGADGDSTFCVRLDPVLGADFGTPVTYAAASRNGCPNLNAYNVIDVMDGGQGNLSYVDQDDSGQPVTNYASVSNDNFDGVNPSGVVLDVFSLHYMRRVAEGYTGSTREDCESPPDSDIEDSTAITQRVADVFTWFGLPTGQNICDYESIVTATDDPSSSPIAKTLLFQNTPNPFNPRTTVRYQIAEEAHVSLQIFDVTGKLVKTLVNGVQAPEAYSISWDGSTDSGSAVSSGVYWARMSTSRGFKASTKMVVLK